jgi:hypothetical protein
MGVWPTDAVVDVIFNHCEALKGDYLGAMPANVAAMVRQCRLTLSTPR